MPEFSYRAGALSCPACGVKGHVHGIDIRNATLTFLTVENGKSVENLHHLGPRVRDCECRDCDSKWIILDDTGLAMNAAAIDSLGPAKRDGGKP